MGCRLRDRFTNETYELSELVLVDRHERKEVGWQEYQSIQRERLAAYTADFDESGFARFFKRCAEIIRTSDGRQYGIKFRVAYNYFAKELKMPEPRINNPRSILSL